VQQQYLQHEQQRHKEENKLMLGELGVIGNWETRVFREGLASGF